jgi:hypothetical protein
MPQVSKYVRTLNKAQQRALARVYSRCPIYARKDDETPLTYRQFRKTVQHSYSCDCAMVEWAGMMLGIETDGYTHS